MHSFCGVFIFYGYGNKNLIVSTKFEDQDFKCFDLFVVLLFLMLKGFKIEIIKTLGNFVDSILGWLIEVKRLLVKDLL